MINNAPYTEWRLNFKVAIFRIAFLAITTSTVYERRTVCPGYYKDGGGVEVSNNEISIRYSSLNW